MENMAIRTKAKDAGIPLWKLADLMGVSEATLTRWMRRPLSPDLAQRMEDAMAKEGAGNDKGTA